MPGPTWPGSRAIPASVGLKAAGDTVVVTFDNPSTDFPALVSGPSFGVVPAAIDDPATLAAGSFVGSGAYVLAERTASELTLAANPNYWAGQAPIGTVHLLTTLGGKSPVDAFEAGTVDYTGIDDSDASWLRYDPSLGPQLRSVPSLSVTYYGFDVRQKPFDDARVRQAFAAAVDWTRIVNLANSGSLAPATSMVPPGIPGRSSRGFLPAYDPAAARQELAAAGYPGGAGLPRVTLVSSDTGFDAAILADLQRNLGVTVSYESMGFDDYFSRLASDPPAFWTLSWVADYPGSNDFLGLLLGTGSTNNYGHWTSTEFDAAIARATAATDATTATAAFDDAQAIVQRDVPVVPVAYGTGFALARAGLLGRLGQRPRHPPLRQPGLGAMSLPRRATGLAVVALLLGLAAPRPMLAASSPVTFAPPSGSFVFGTSITFSDAVVLPATPKRVELLLTQPGSIGPSVIGVANPAPASTP